MKKGKVISKKKSKIEKQDRENTINKEKIKNMIRKTMKKKGNSFKGAKTDK